jgi:hypothetical protein
MRFQFQQHRQKGFEMCERCVAAQKALEKNAERIQELVDGALATLSGNYPSDVLEMIAKEPFPEDKPFAETLFQLSSAATRLATAQALIESALPSDILDELAMVARQGETAAGLGRGIRAVAIPLSDAEGLLAALFGGLPNEPDEPTTLH